MTRLFAAALICLTATGAQTQGMPQCAEREALVQFLADKYGEALRFVGVNSVQVTELFVNDATGSWTILVTPPRGLTCMRAGGYGASVLEATEIEEKT